MSEATGTAARGRADRELLLAALLAGAAVVVILAARWRGGGLFLHIPVASDPVARATGLRLLGALALAEAALLAALAAVAALRGGWLRRLGGVAFVERHPASVLASLWALHAVSILLWFPLGDLASPDPATTCDNAYHYYQIYAAHQFLQRGHHVWGYNPDFMAGYPAGVLFDIDMKGAGLFCHLLAFVGLPYAFKAYILLAHLFFPPVLYAAGRLLGMRRPEAFLGLLLGLLFWHWGRPLLGHFRWAGMHSYVLASYLAVLALALFVRGFETQGRGRRLCQAALVLLVAVAWQVHALALLLLVPGFVAAYVAGFRRLRRSDHLALLTGLVLVVAANADWLLPALRFRHYKTASDYWFQFHGLRDIAFVYSRETSLLFSAITVLGVVGLVRWRRTRPLAAIAVGASAVAWFLAAFYGSRWQVLANTEPGRYLLPFVLAMTVPAGAAFFPLVERLQRRRGPALVAAGLLVVASLAPALAVGDAWFFDVHRIRARVDPRFRELLGFLREHTSRDARLLFETPGGFYNQSDLLYGGHLQALVPIETGREAIGGPYPVNFMVHAAVDFANGELLGRKLREWSSEEFAHFLDTYNVGWVVCWSASARAYLDARADLAARRADFDRFRVYELRRSHSYVLSGAGRVRSDYSRIEVDDVAGDEVILSYHWLESLRTEPPLPLDAVPIPGDPVGFVRVRPGGVTRFTIVNAY